MLATAAILAVALAIANIIQWRKNMDIATINSKLTAAAAAVDARLAADAAEIEALKANQNNPAALQAIADGLDAITAKVS